MPIPTLPNPRALFASAALVAGALLSGACSSGGAVDDPALEGDPIEVAEGVPATGNVHVSLRTWDATSGPGGKTWVLVNASSEVGQKLRTGRATSTVTRVLDDAGMGSLLATFEENGFSKVAVGGVTLDSLPEDSRRKGVLIVEQDGASRALISAPNVGRSVATIYRDCKVLFLQVHGSIPGAAVSVGTGDADPERTFRAPPIRMNR